MIDQYVHPLTILQGKNAFISLLNFAAVGVFATILIADRKNYRDVYWQALALMAVYMVGEAAEQTWYWAWRHFDTGNPAWLTDWRMILVLSFNVVIALGCVGIIRVFTLARFGHRLWFAVTGLCFLASVASFFVPKI